MRKTVLSFFLVVYIISNVGFGMYQHFCGGELISQSIFKGNIKSCCGDDKKEISDDGCCKTKYSYIKVKDVQKTSVTEKLQNTKQNSFFVESYSLLNFKINLLLVNNLIFHPPPNKLSTAIYLRNRVLII